MMCALSNARSAIPASGFRSLSKRAWLGRSRHLSKLRHYLDSECNVPLRIGRWLARTFAVGKRAIAHNVKNPRLSYLFTPVVGVSAGVWVAPDFGMTVSFIVVVGILGL
jgi:hypothetical protein